MNGCGTSFSNDLTHSKPDGPIWRRARKVDDLQNAESRKTPAGGTGGEQQDGKKPRKSMAEKMAVIASHLQANPNATGQEIADRTGIHPTDVSRIAKPMRKALKEGKRLPRRGWKRNDGQPEAVDEAISCQICNDPLEGAWECEVCDEIVKGECKTCHFTNTHPDKATP